MGEKLQQTHTMKVVIKQIEARNAMPLLKHHIMATIFQLRTFLTLTELEYGRRVRNLRSFDRAESFHWLSCNRIEEGIKFCGYGRILVLWPFRFGKTILLHKDGGDGLKYMLYVLSYVNRRLSILLMMIL